MVASGQIVLGILAEIPESGRQAVAAMFQRRATERPEGVLQPFGEGHVASPPRMTWACSKPE